MRTLLFSLILIGFGVSDTARAARIIRFFGSGDNTFSYGEWLGPPKQATCKLTVNNQSGTPQNYTITLAAETAATNLAPGAVTITSNPAGLTMGDQHQITDNTSHTYTLTYPQVGQAATGTQQMKCNGTISIDDPTATPGSLGFSGVINTITESPPLNPQDGSKAIPGFVPITSGQN